MPIARVVTQSRTEAAVDNLASYVAEAGLKVNDRLPAERELAAKLGVSRPILREALSHLAALGVIESRTGSGTYLCNPITPTDRHVIMRIEGERRSLMQLLELRRALEVEAAALAAIKASSDQIEQLCNYVERLEQDFAEKGNNPAADRAFHLALYEYAGNPLFLQLTESVWKTLQQFWEYPLGKQDFAKRTLPLHRTIYEKIRDRDPDGARVAVHQLLDIVEEDLRA